MKFAFLYFILTAAIINAELFSTIKLTKLQYNILGNVNSIDYVKRIKEHALNKYSKVNRHYYRRHHNYRRQNQSSIPLILDFAYSGNITVGNQNFTVLLDTGSSNFYVPSKNCASITCKHHKRFDPAKSPTFIKEGLPWTIQYGTGNASGITGIDNVKFGGFTAKKQIFGLATSISDDNDPFINDGILGLGLDVLNTMDNGAPTVFSTLVTQKQINPIFGFHLTDSDGTFTLGGVDNSSFTSKINFNKVVGFPDVGISFWFLDIDDAIVNGKPLSFTQKQAVIDTGTSVIILTVDDAAKLHSQIPGSQFVPSDGAYHIPCNTTAVVSFEIGGIKYAIPPKDLILQQDGDDCISAIIPIDILPNVWILGIPFLKNVYSVYGIKNKTAVIGFAT